MFPIGIFFVLWVVLPEDNDALEEWYLPPKIWSIHIPTSLLCLFFAAPLLYAACNHTILAPKIDSLDTLYDDYTRPVKDEGRATQATADSLLLSVPDICDLDPSTLRFYSHVDGKPIIS